MQALSEQDWAAVDRMTAIGLFADGRYDEFGSLLDAILPALRRLEPPPVWAMLLNYRAVSRTYSQSKSCLRRIEEAYQAVILADDPMVPSYVALHYSNFLRLRGDFLRAHQLVDRGSRLAGLTADRNLLALAHYSAAALNIETNHLESAQRDLLEAVHDWRSIDHVEGLIRALSVASQLAARRGSPRLAARLVGASTAAREKRQLPAWPLVAEHELRIRQSVQAALAPREWDSEVAAGRLLSVDRAVETALLTPAPSAKPSREHHSIRHPWRKRLSRLLRVHPDAGGTSRKLRTRDPDADSRATTHATQDR